MSTQSVKTRAWEQLQVERNIRPYRMVVIKFYAQSLNAVGAIYEYIFNEFGNFIEGVDGTSIDGYYVLNIKSDTFKDLNNVQISVNWGARGTSTYTLLTSIITSTNITINCNDNTFFPLALEGFLFITIKEYYA
jgi:hypothetical protein